MQGPIRAIVVDDSSSAIRAICSILQRKFEIEVVGTAQDGQEALLLADRVRPQLALLDIQMPVMNGVEAARIMTQRFPELRVVLVTGHDCPEIRESWHDSGAHDYIPKERLQEELATVLTRLFAPVR